jgi:CRP-like cAMP-binding protein
VMDFFWSLPKTSIVGLNDPLKELFMKAQPRHFDANTIISDPDQSPQRAYLCTSGTLKVTKLLSSGREILITILEPGSIWSDRSLLKGYWRGVFVETMSSADVVSIDKVEFEKYICGSHCSKISAVATSRRASRRCSYAFQSNTVSRKKVLLLSTCRLHTRTLRI